MKIVILPVVLDKIEELVPLLYEKGYFSYKAEARKYVDALYDDIQTNLPLKIKKPAPEYFENKYGKGLYYSVFRKSKQTCWYVFFRMYEENGYLIYQIRHMTNNHVDAKYFNQIES